MRGKEGGIEGRERTGWGWNSSYRVLWAEGRIWAFTLRKMRALEVCGQGAVESDSGTHRCPLAAVGRRFVGNKLRLNEAGLDLNSNRRENEKWSYSEGRTNRIT